MLVCGGGGGIYSRHRCDHCGNRFALRRRKRRKSATDGGAGDHLDNLVEYDPQPIKCECPECGADMDPEETVCPNCLAEFGFYCPECDEEIAADATVCPNCGTELDEDFEDATAELEEGSVCEIVSGELDSALINKYYVSEAQ